MKPTKRWLKYEIFRGYFPKRIERVFVCVRARACVCVCVCVWGGERRWDAHDLYSFGTKKKHKTGAGQSGGLAARTVHISCMTTRAPTPWYTIQRPELPRRTNEYPHPFINIRCFSFFNIDKIHSKMSEPTQLNASHLSQKKLKKLKHLIYNQLNTRALLRVTRLMDPSTVFCHLNME